MSELDAALAVEPKQPVRTERNFALTEGIAGAVRCGTQARWSFPVDAFEKIFSYWRKKFFSPTGASYSGQREGPHRITQKRSQTFVDALQRLAAAETKKN